ncbi:phage terminase large subunit family protein [Bradyrhizobium arachidis]|nr:phage terminase large subunit family protein [Bradyrhizobium arachidis]
MVASAFRCFKPPPKLSLPNWIEKNVRLPAGSTALPGPMRLYPYQRDMAAAIGDAEIERVTVVKGVRIGWTALLTGALGHYVKNDPAPIIALLPTESDCRDYTTSDLEPTFEASPALRGMLSDDQKEGERNTMLSRRFSGGSLRIIAAGAPRNLRAKTARILFADEADAMSITPEGDPLVLAERRTLSFPNRKIVIGSTPVFEDTSAVLRRYAESDQRVFEVPCPACGAFNEIQWQHIVWEDGKPETACYKCPHCQAQIDERKKNLMVMHGEWRATKPEITNHAGFRINCLVSPLANARWGILAAEFVKAQNDPSKLQAFRNTILAEGWREPGEELNDLEIAGRREAFSLDAIPQEVLLITCGIDVQGDRLEAVILGHGRDSEMFVLGHEVIWGAPTDEETWLELDQLLQKQWRHPYGNSIGIDACAIDSGGHWTEAVYNFCTPRLRRRVLAIKGMQGPRPILQSANHHKTKKGARIFLVGVDTVKAALFSRLKRNHGIRFSHTLENAWFDQLCSERLVVRYVKGAPQRRFERLPGKRAEALDGMCYAIAARQIISASLTDREDALKVERPLPAKPTVFRSNFMHR